MTKLGDIILRGILADRPAFGVEGRLYFATDTLELWRDSGAAWESVEGTAGGSTVESLSVDDVTIEDIGTATDPDIRVKAGGLSNSHINAAAAIALSKLATDPLARANHTGTQLAATVSNFDTQVRTNRLDQMAAPTADVSMNSNKVTNVTDPSSAQDAATKAYVDGLLAGLSWKPSVRAASTANGTLATAFENGDSLDGVTLATGDRILLKDQSAGEANGIYVVAASGAPTRATDADTAAEILGAAVFVREGTANADKGFVCTTNGPITLGSTSLSFTQFPSSGGGSAHTIEDETTPLTARTKLSFQGPGVTATDDSGNDRTIVSVPGATGGVTEHSYVEVTSPLTVTATSDATAQTFISSAAVAYDGSTRVKIEFFSPLFAPGASQAIVANLYDGSTDLGEVGEVVIGQASFFVTRYLTPSNATHTYHFKVWKTSGVATVHAGAGGTATLMPAFIRITTA